MLEKLLCSTKGVNFSSLIEIWMLVLFKSASSISNSVLDHSVHFLIIMSLTGVSSNDDFLPTDFSPESIGDCQC